MSLPSQARDEVTPIASLAAFKRQYIISWIQLYRDFFRQIGVAMSPDEIGGKNSGVNYAASCKLFNEISHGIRRLDWCPAGLGLCGNLQEFFLSRGMEFYAQNDFVQGRLLNLVSAESIWLVVSESRYFASSREHKVSVHDSGAFEDLRLPSMVQLVYLLAAAIYRHKKITAASLNPDRMTFIRSSDFISPGEILSTAYVPGQGLKFRSFPIRYSGPDLVTMDAFVLP